MNKILKKIAFVVLAGILLSSSCREIDGTEVVVNDNSEFIQGTITEKHSEGDCGFLIATAVDGDRTQYYFPVELGNEFKVEGMKVEMKFHTSRIQQTTCLNAQPIIIDEMRALSTGTIHLTDGGCGIYIDAKDNGTSKRLYPIDLPEQFKKEGLKIEFSYSLSRAPQPEGCLVDHVVVITSANRTH
jgi:hypothetical protein